MKKHFYLAIASMLMLTHVFAQKETITLDEIWKDYKFYAKGIDELRSTNDGNHYTYITFEGGMQSIIEKDYATGKMVDTLLTSKDLVKAGNGFIIEDYALSPGEKNILLSSGGERIYRHSSISKYYIWNREKKTVTKLTDGNEKVMYATISPDGNMAAYIYKGDLYAKNLIDGKTTRITNDGSENIFNGVSDWVYEEEFTVTRAYFWSPDSKSIAYYRFDDSKVPTFSMNEYKDSLYPSVYSFKYPKAGANNPTVAIHIYHIGQGNNVTVSVGKNYEYIPRIKWTQSSNTLSVQYMDRHQDTLILALADANTGKATPILTEGDKGYIDINDALTFINNNTEFIWLSDADGYNHLYRYSISGKMENQITKGKWDVLSCNGIDEKRHIIYYVSSETSAIDKDVCSINWDGTNKKKLNSKIGANEPEFSSTFNYYINSFSNIDEPGITTVNTCEGKEMRVMEDNKTLKDTLKNYYLGKKSFFSFTTSQGVNLNGWMILPPGFDSTKKYPVLMYVYGGPGDNTVENNWDGLDNMWFQMMAQKGYIIASIDNRGTGARGSEFKKCTYMHLGKLETEDQIEGAKYFGSKSFVDKARIGIWGWSYGGYMAAMCITQGADYFKTAISVAPVTDWDFYDSIYTERYMRTPQENKDGYAESAPIHYADMLKGHYLLVHGTSDDNVHFQNSIEWIRALEKAEKPFSLMIYPDKNHGIYGGNTRHYLFTQMTNFLLTNL
jgi:dipeptidyl-peptidase-4